MGASNQKKKKKDLGPKQYKWLDLGLMGVICKDQQLRALNGRSAGLCLGRAWLKLGSSSSPQRPRLFANEPDSTFKTLAVVAVQNEGQPLVS